VIYLGVDGGALGAISAIDANGALVMVEDMPYDEVHDGGKNRKRISAPRLADLLRPFYVLQGGQVSMVLEMPDYRPMVVRNKRTGQKETLNLSGASMGHLGEAVGIVIGIAAAFRISFTGVSPHAWKRAVQCPADKDDARKRASELFPVWSHAFSRKKDDGRAESALLAAYCRKVAIV
jgi:hypothetical protein